MTSIVSVTLEGSYKAIRAEAGVSVNDVVYCMVNKLLDG